MVRFLICLRTQLWQNKWCMIKTFLGYDPECRSIHRNTEFSLLPLRGKSASTTIPYFRPCFPVQLTLLYYHNTWFLVNWNMNILLLCFVMRRMLPVCVGSEAAGTEKWRGGGGWWHKSVWFWWWGEKAYMQLQYYPIKQQNPNMADMIIFSADALVVIVGASCTLDGLPYLTACSCSQACK